MSDQLKKTLIGALVAIALAIAVSYGLISQQTADKIQDQTSQALQGNQPPSPPQPSAQPAPQSPGTQAPAPQNSAPAPAQ